MRNVFDRDNLVPSAFISYSHDSEAHKQRVADLVTRLRAEGIECELDQWVVSPAEGWPKWMLKNVMSAKFVLVVCTERYFRRITGLDEDGGLGSRWEGALITQELYDAGGANTKFIPIVLVPDDERHRPPFLRGATYYDVSTPAGYERLYRHLTEQPASVKPPLGKIRRLVDDDTPSTTRPEVQPPGPTSRPQLEALVLIFAIDGEVGPITARSLRAELGQTLVLEIDPEDTKTSAMLAVLRQRKGLQLGIAFGTTPVFGILNEAKQTFENGDERWLISVNPSTEHIQGTFGEMAFDNRSADDIAELRARRLLLNERLPTDSGATPNIWNTGMLDVLVHGLNSPLSIKGSPFPGLFKALRVDIDYFLVVARLFGVLFLYLSATVDRIYRLELQLVRSNVLHVVFEGQRPRRYTNVEPPTIRVTGECNLDLPEAEA